MIHRLGSIAVAAGLALSCSGAGAQDDQGDRSLTMVSYIHSDCPDGPAGEPGASRETAIDVYFGDLWYAAEEAVRDENELARSEFECRWVRVSGALTWMDDYGYQGVLRYSTLDVYWGGQQRFVVEDFVAGSPRRSDLARRQVTLVGRFYDLCGAAEREAWEAGETWWVFGPCHYGRTDGMMLDDVSVEEIHDPEPQYILGDANRRILRSLSIVEGDARQPLVQAVRDWAALVRQGPAAVADRAISIASMSDDDAEATRIATENPDSYVSYVHDEPRFARLSLRAAEVEVFQDPEREDLIEAFGCVCLEDSCADRWPLTSSDAENFLGDAACVVLWRRDEDVDAWQWW